MDEEDIVRELRRLNDVKQRVIGQMEAIERAAGISGADSDILYRKAEQLESWADQMGSLEQENEALGEQMEALLDELPAGSRVSERDFPAL